MKRVLSLLLFMTIISTCFAVGSFADSSMKKIEIASNKEFTTGSELNAFSVDKDGAQHGTIATPGKTNEKSYILMKKGTKGAASFFTDGVKCNDSNFFKQERILEFDLYIDEVGDNNMSLHIYSNNCYRVSSIILPSDTGSKSVFKGNDGKEYEIIEDKWIHVRIVFNFAKGEMEPFVDVNADGTEISLGKKTFSPDTKNHTIYIFSDINKKNVGASEVYIDNIILSKLEPAAYVESSKLYVGNNSYDLNEAPSNPDKMTVTFGTTMDNSVLNNKNNIVILEDGSIIDNNQWSVSYDSESKTLRLVFSPHLKRNTEYKVTIKTKDDEFEFNFTTAVGEPTISMYGIYEGSILDYGSDSKVFAVTDDEGIISLYVDNELYDSISSSKSHEFVLSNLSGGIHTIKASVLVGENEYFTNEVNFKVLSSKHTTVMSTKFQEEKGTFWIYNSDGGYVPTPNIKGEFSYMFTIPGNNGKVTEFVATKDSTQDRNFDKEDRLIEYDLYVDSAGAPNGAWSVMTYINGIYKSMNVMEKSESDNLPVIKDVSGKIYTVELNKWYHYVVKLSIVNNRMETFVDVDGSGVPVSLGILDLSSEAAATDLRVSTNGTGEPILYIDNLCIIKADYSACVESIELISKPDEVIDNYRKTQLFAQFNVPMIGSTLNEDTITVQCNGEDIEIDKIEYDNQKKGVLISFKRPLKSNTDYTIVMGESIRTSTNMRQPSTMVINFNTGLNDIDTNSFGAKSGGLTISNLSDIKEGDSVTFEYTLVNDTTKVFDTEVLIFVAYENNTLVYFDIKPLNGISTTGDEGVVINSSTYRAGATPDRVEAYIWKNMDMKYSIVDKVKMN